MQLDKLTTLADRQAVTATAYTENSYDTWNGAAALPTDWHGRKATADLGIGAAPELLAQVVEDFVGGTSVALALVQATGVDATTGVVNAGIAEVGRTAAIPVATLKAGYKFRLAIPHGLDLRYLAAQFVVVGTPTAGEITVGLVGSPLETNHRGY